MKPWDAFWPKALVHCVEYDIANALVGYLKIGRFYRESTLQYLSAPKESVFDFDFAATQVSACCASALLWELNALIVCSCYLLPVLRGLCSLIWCKCRIENVCTGAGDNCGSAQRCVHSYGRINSTCHVALAG